ncbi:phosphoglycerate mutase [Microdochium trichocladiopsis]|uniref:Phosphoglycerate mutase n=1 Tax=Microdochium trichocladiopsis TaxID=1682393 RepID=A0A9P8YJB2_9PEZI|nr:phosphoglycerate mutase [Microdochium trichocladiopsis]KAH7040953.1 phosphoglycerate mutase [Microdochium trichocladiopsis]
MSDANATTPRVFIARHGETEWTISGQCTGNTADIPLTARGEDQVRATAALLVGAGKLIDPARLARVFCSPRQRAVRTMELLLGEEDAAAARASASKGDRTEHASRVVLTEDIREWDYGAYEGLRPGEIAERRRSQGKGKWDIWVDGCEDGERPDQVEARLDRLIAEIKAIQAPVIHGGPAPDVLIVAHGHILRAFVKRWLRFPMNFAFAQMMEPGAIGILSYAHHNIEEPALLVGMGFPASS